MKNICKYDKQTATLILGVLMIVRQWEKVFHCRVIVEKDGYSVQPGGRDLSVLTAEMLTDICENVCHATDVAKVSEIVEDIIFDAAVADGILGDEWSPAEEKEEFDPLTLSFSSEEGAYLEESTRRTPPIKFNQPSLRPSKEVQKLIYAHGLAAYSAHDSMRNAKEVMKITKDNKGQQICCTLKGAEIGEVGIYIKGAVCGFYDRDIFSWKDGDKIRLSQKARDARRIMNLRDLKGLGPDHEAIVSPLRVVGVWYKGGDTDNEVSAIRIAEMFEVPLYTI